MRTTGAGQSALLLLDVVEVLVDRKIGYAVIGAPAASVHGAVRASMDADVDLLVGLRGLEAQAFSRTVEVPFQGKTLNFIGREDFIAMKAFAGGPVDIADAARAITAAAGSLDIELVQRLAARYGREASAALSKLLAG